MRTANRRTRSRTAAHRQRPWAEPLEPRLLLSAVTEYGGLIGSNPNDITHDSSGNVWFISESGHLGKIDATTHAISQYFVSDYTESLTVGSDGNLWITTYNSILVADTTGHLLDSFLVSANTPETRTPQFITTGSNGDIYFTAQGYQVVNQANGTGYTPGWVGRISPSEVGGVHQPITYYATDSDLHTPTRIISAPDGNLYIDLIGAGVDSPGPNGYISLRGTSVITRMTVDGAMTNFTLPTEDVTVTDLAAAPDGSIWYSTAESADPVRTNHGTDRLVHMTIDSNDQTTFVGYDADNNTPDSTPSIYGLTVGLDGTVFAAELNTNQIVQLNPATGVFTNYPLPTDFALPSYLTTTPDGSIWFTEYYVNQIGQITPSTGSITTFGKSLQLSPAENFSGTVATFTTTLGAVPVDQFTVSIDWGDSTAATTGTVTYDSTTDTYSVQGTHAYASNGQYAITASIVTSGAPEATADSTALVGPAINLTPLTFTQQENIAYTGSVATFTMRRPVTSNTMAVIGWGDGTSDYGTIAALGDGSYAVIGSHTYQNAGTYSVLVSVEDDPDIVNATSTAQITATPIVASGTHFRALLHHIAIGVVANFTADVDATASQFSAVINWGDGQTSQGLVVANPNQAGQFYVIGVHFYWGRGNYNALTTITDSVSSQVATATSVITA